MVTVVIVTVVTVTVATVRIVVATVVATAEAMDEVTVGDSGLPFIMVPQFTSIGSIMPTILTGLRGEGFTPTGITTLSRITFRAMSTRCTMVTSTAIRGITTRTGPGSHNVSKKTMSPGDHLRGSSRNF